MSLEQVKQQIDEVARSSGFRCVPVSWEDAQRGTVAGALSCWGGNISDVRLWEKSGRQLYTVRSENWNERLGYVAAKDVAVVVGNHMSGGQQLGNVTLQTYLADASQYGGYAGLRTASLSENQSDRIFSIRFQTVFLPVGGDISALSRGSAPVDPSQLGRVEFCTDVYNYNTHSDEDPRNLLMLCTAQGTSLQQDGRGTKKMFLHEVDPAGTIHRYWLEAERSAHKVGGAQQETREEAEAAAARGKATAVHIGTRAMGTRFNVQMLIQLPVEQKPKPILSGEFVSFCPSPGGFAGYLGLAKPETKPKPKPTLSNLNAMCMEMSEGCSPQSGLGFAGAPPVLLSPSPISPISSGALSARPHRRPLGAIGSLGLIMEPETLDDCSGDLTEGFEDHSGEYGLELAPAGAPLAAGGKGVLRGKLSLGGARSRVALESPKVGISNAARVSRGTEEDTWAGLSRVDAKRDKGQHGTITVTMYQTVVGGIPSEADVVAAIQDLDGLYEACPKDVRLADATEVTAELNVKHLKDIQTKVTTQGYQPPVKSSQIAGGFPE